MATLPTGKVVVTSLDTANVGGFMVGADAVISLGVPYESGIEPWLSHIRPRVLIDGDPGFTQVWADERGVPAVFGEHDLYFSISANIRTERSSLPTHGLPWRSIWNPVVLDWWRVGLPVLRPHFTTICSLWGNG